MTVVFLKTVGGITLQEAAMPLILTFPPLSPPFKRHTSLFVAMLGIVLKRLLPSLNRNADKGRGISVAVL